jgi:hypothetical protein
VIKRAALAVMLTSALSIAQADEQPSNLELYAASSLIGMHSHPIGFEGRKLEKAEAAHNQRRKEMSANLAKTMGEAALQKIDDDLEQQAWDVYWVSAPSLAQEWRSLNDAKRALATLNDRLALFGSDRK